MRVFGGLRRGHSKRQDGQAFEMGPAVEGGGRRCPPDERVEAEEAVDEKAGNKEDQRNMRRVGKEQELKVSDHNPLRQALKTC